jgi:hypothetical protein
MDVRIGTAQALFKPVVLATRAVLPTEPHQASVLWGAILCSLRVSPWRCQPLSSPVSGSYRYYSSTVAGQSLSYATRSSLCLLAENVNQRMIEGHSGFQAMSSLTISFRPAMWQTIKEHTCRRNILTQSQHSRPRRA